EDHHATTPPPAPHTTPAPDQTEEPSPTYPQQPDPSSKTANTAASHADQPGHCDRHRTSTTPTTPTDDPPSKTPTTRSRYCGAPESSPDPYPPHTSATLQTSSPQPA